MTENQQTAFKQICNILKESGLSIKEADFVLDEIRNKIFEPVYKERDALCDMLVK
jgi:hypothetical protein